jgi:hypothetical protein
MLKAHYLHKEIYNTLLFSRSTLTRREKEAGIKNKGRLYTKANLIKLCEFHGYDITLFYITPPENNKNSNSLSLPFAIFYLKKTAVHTIIGEL